MQIVLLGLGLTL